MVKPKLKRSPKWAYRRKKHLKTEPQCQWCNSETNLQVHHIVPVHINPALELEDSNMITLCETPNYNCHRRVGHFGNWQKFNPNVRKDCLERQTKKLA